MGPMRDPRGVDLMFVSAPSGGSLPFEGGTIGASR
jgi:hypothetical protein